MTPDESNPDSGGASDATREAGRPRILVLDDEAELRAMLQRYLSGQGHVVRAVADARELDRLLGRERFDVLVLDLMMPGEDGLAICRRLRQRGETIPILMLTARGDPVDRIVGLEMGADDYLPKPFNPRELLARVQAMLRRQQMLGAAPAQGVRQILRFGPYRLDPVARKLERVAAAGADALSATAQPEHGGHEIVALTSGEYALLHALASYAGRPLGRERLMELAYGRDHQATDRSIDVQILRLRKLIEPDPAVPRYIQTVRGYGYVFAAEQSATDQTAAHQTPSRGGGS